MKQTITIREHDEIFAGKEFNGVKFTDTQFNLLENFILANTAENDDGAPVNVMGLTNRRGRKIITAKQYVGTITLKDGTNIEILPKIYRGNGEEEKVKRIFRDMLRALYKSKSVNYQNANLEVDKLPLFEIFISMFLDEVLVIVKRGLKGGYVTIDSNENFLKGKLLLNEHICKNYIHKEKFYIRYDEFNTNQPENRLIKSTLVYLDKRTRSAKNKQLIKNLLAMFDDVPCSETVDVDIAASKVSRGRGSNVYRTAVIWSEVFLKGKTFTTFAGEKYARVLLFDMNDLFESYVAKKVRRYLQEKKPQCNLYVQDGRYYLFNTPENSFLLQPDMVIRDKSGDEQRAYILDTKWKILEKDKTNNGVSQADIYQMYAYFKEYEAHKQKPESVTLVYPLTDDPVCAKKPCYTNDYSKCVGTTHGANVKIRTWFVDLTNIDESVKELVENLDK